MKQLKLQKFQNNLRLKFLKMGVNMIGPETVYFSCPESFENQVF